MSKPISPCDQCAHFVPYQGDGPAPRGHNPCGRGHRMEFKRPTTAGDLNWGFFRRGCADRKKVKR